MASCTPPSKRCWLPSEGQDFQRVSSMLHGCKTALTKLPAGTAPGATNYALLFYGSPGTPKPAWPIQLYSSGPRLACDPPGPLASPAARSPSHVPTGPAPFYPLGDPRKLPSGSAETARPVPGAVEGKAPAPGDKAGRAPGSQAWEQAKELQEKSHPARGEPSPCLAASAACFGPPFPGAGRP